MCQCGCFSSSRFHPPPVTPPTTTTPVPVMMSSVSSVMTSACAVVSPMQISLHTSGPVVACFSLAGQRSEVTEGAPQTNMIKPSRRVFFIFPTAADSKFSGTLYSFYFVSFLCVLRRDRWTFYRPSMVLTLLCFCFVPSFSPDSTNSDSAKSKVRLPPLTPS